MNATTCGDFTSMSTNGDSEIVDIVYDTYGTFCPVCNISNLVDFLVFENDSLCIDVDQRMVGVATQVTPVLAISGVTVVGITTTLEWGTR